MGIMAYIFNIDTQKMEYKYVDDLAEMVGLKDAEARAWYQAQVQRYIAEGDEYVYDMLRYMANNPERRL